MSVSLRQIMAPLLDFAFPPRCPACGEGVVGGPDGTEALCHACWGRLDLPGVPACIACQRPVDPGNAGLRCDRCADDPPVHDGIAAATAYGPVSRDLVLAFKHGGRIGLADAMGRMMAMRLTASFPVAGDALLVPVPLHRWRLWKRGYNQSVLLAAAMARTLAISHAPDGLIRVRRTPSLGARDAQARREVLRGAIAANPVHAASLSGRKIILVDDVLTSGATSDACVAALRQAGAASVIVACYARVL